MNLQEIRNQIDEIDKQLTSLFETRMDIVKQVALFKQKENLPILQLDREQAVLTKVKENIKQEHLKEKGAFFFQSLMDVSKNSQYPYIETRKELKELIEQGKQCEISQTANVVCQGVPGSYSHLCADSLYPQSQLSFCETFLEVFQQIEAGKADLGILPIENSSAGSVIEVYDLMKEFDFYIVGSKKVKIEHNLLAKQGTQKEEIHTVHSHWQALKQCEKYLRSLNFNKEEARNTAIAAQLVANSLDKGVGCIASKKCATLYNLTCLESGVEDYPNNFTRFIVIAKKPVVRDEHNRIALVVQLSHRPGSLYQLLTKFAIEQINLTKIESRPLPNTDFEFLFYLDLEANLLNKSVEKLLSALAGEVKSLEILGSFTQE